MRYFLQKKLIRLREFTPTSEQQITSSLVVSASAVGAKPVKGGFTTTSEGQSVRSLTVFPNAVGAKPVKGGFTTTSEGQSVRSLTVFPNAVGAKPVQHGFTLIELLLYVGITTIMLGVLGGIGVNVLTSTVKTKALEEVNYNAQTLFHSVVTSVENASDILEPNVLATSSTLSLTMSDVEKNPTVYSLEGGVLFVREGSGVAKRLSTRTITVNELKFERIGAIGTTPAVRISMGISSLSSSTQQATGFEEEFITTARIKKTP